MPSLRVTVLALITTGIVSTALPSPAAAADADGTAAAKTVCPGTFTVLHDDRIGTLKLPAGPYVMTTTGGLTCGQASALFTRFLQDWDGVLPSGWKVKGSGFQRGTSTVGFTVKANTVRPTPPPAGGTTCPGQFTVRANSRIGALSLPKGNYVIQLTKKTGSLTCVLADRELAMFLTTYRTAPLPSPWQLNAKTATFTSGGGVGFRVVKGTGGTGGGGSTTGTKCNASFRVMHNDMIGKLSVRAGSYWIYTIGKLTCQQATADFKLDLQNGRLPNANWTLDVQTATFMFLKTRGFRVEPVNGV